MHKLLPYSIIFSVASGLAATGAYIIAPSKVIDGANVAHSSNNSKPNNNTSEEDEETFIPVELTPRDYLIDNLTKMKTLDASGEATICFNDLDLGLNINKLYLTDPIGNLELYCDVTISLNGESTNIEVTYAQGTIYLSLLDTDIKLATSDFSRITDMLSGFDLPEIELPEALTNLNLDDLTQKLGNMPYKETEDGYEFCLELFEGSSVYFLSDKEYNFTGLSAKDFVFEGLKLNLEATMETKYEIETPVAIPETLNRRFQNFCDILPLAGHIGELVKQRQFALNVSGHIIEDGQLKGTTIKGSTQFDLDKKVGQAKLNVVEHEFDDQYKHNVSLDISTEDIVFKYNDSIKGKLAFSSLESIIEFIQSIAGNFGKEIPTSIEGIVSLLDGSVIGDVLTGKYEALLRKGLVKNIILNNELVSLSIDKSVLGLAGDITVAINFNEEKLLGVTISNIKVLNLTISLDAQLGTWNDNYDCGIDRASLEGYGDYANLVPLIKGISSLIEQKQFAIKLEGSLQIGEDASGLSFNGSTQFDLDKQFGDGELVITENETEFGAVNHKVNVGYEGKDVRFAYNDKLYGKFTTQSILDTFDTLIGLVKSENSRIYEWFGDTIENMNETILMKIVNGEYWLLFHDILKELVVEDNQLSLTVSGKIFNFDGDITVKVGFANEKITSVRIVDFEAFGMKVNLKASLVDYVDNYERLPLPNMQGAPKYYDFSEINTLVKLGIDVINLDYFHITGTVDLNMNVIGIDLDKLFSIKALPLDIKVFENNGDIGIQGKLSNIPTVGVLNGLTLLSDDPKTLDFYYKDSYFYLTRTEVKKTLGFFTTNSETVVERIRLTTDEFVDNLVYYLLGWSMGLERSSLVWNKITDAIENPAPRTKPMDYAALLKNYEYQEGNNAYGLYKWFLDIDIAELANNSELTKLNATIYGNNFSLTDPDTNETVEKRFLTHLDAQFAVSAGGVFNLDLSAGLDLNKNEYDTCFVSYNEFSTDSRISSYWNAFNSYINAHVNDSLYTH